MKLIEKILLTYDFSNSSKNVLATAIELAKIFQSTIVPIHVLPDDIVNEKVKALLEETATQKLEEAAKLIKSEGVTVEKPVLAFGSPHERIIQVAINTNTNLILTGSGETQQGEKFLLGTTATRIIQKSEKPVFVVKEGAALNVQHILCPVDFSANSKRALKNAITMAHRFKAELTVLSVCEFQGSKWFPLERDMAEENNIRSTEHRKQFDSFLQGFNLAGLNWNKEIRKGKPAEEILSIISGKMVDLLVIGTTGKTGLNRLVLGSVAEKVIREVPCSFLILKAEDIVTLQLETKIRDIEKHFETAEQLMNDGFFEESINQYKLCLSINSMHVPSYFGIAKVYEKLDDSEKAKIYRDGGREILNRIWDRKIEEEARKLRSH